MSDIVTSFILAAFGTLEGYAFARCGMVDPQIMKDQMLFKRFVIMKLFFSAVGGSMLAQSALSFFAPKKFSATRAYVKSNVPMARAVLGCFTLGCGMYIAGSGPTMIPAQLGAFVQSAPAIILGACFGGAVYHFMEPFVGEATPESCPMTSGNDELGPRQASISSVNDKEYFKSKALDLKLGVSYPAAAIPFACALLGGVAFLEKMFPHESTDMQGLMKPSGMIHPVWAGLAIGFNQIPLRLLAGISQGGSSSVMNIISTLSFGFIAPKYQLKSISAAAQLVYVYVGTTLGAYFAYVTTHVPTGQAPPVGFGFLQTFIGAAIMIFGGRYANGCTCGHGISGFSELSFTSIAAAMSIFAGGIGTAIIDKLVRG